MASAVHCITPTGGPLLQVDQENLIPVFRIAPFVVEFMGKDKRKQLFSKVTAFGKRKFGLLAAH